jgi:hypothetical protein
LPALIIALVIMSAFALLSAVAATLQASAPPPPVAVRAQTQVFVQIIRAAEVRNGETSSPHQRTMRRDARGEPLILLQFE